MRNQLLYLFLYAGTMITTTAKRLTPSRSERERGASILEYAAVIILVGGVAVALMQLEVFNDIPTTVSRAIQNVLDPPE
ncbi:hypothetical protein [Streptomonospora litoralis]|uniref:Uncharacterized protein n=1 Tax=Streptomonospora litoralis TaxID=2498135 RepID=A0A4P6PY13_9ACTN|nr:hypothetical protein [Streptomonospora litoralis]QBI53166.1 hypothetical protein EKD16_06845 [Streptomonospora litoralis]